MVQREREVRNAARREHLHQQSKKDKRKAKLQRRMDLKKAERSDAAGQLRAQRLATNVPRTIENTREWLGGEDAVEEQSDANSVDEDDESYDENIDSDVDEQARKAKTAAKGKGKAVNDDTADTGDARTRPVRIKSGTGEDGDDLVLDMAGLEDLFPPSTVDDALNADGSIPPPKPILLTTSPRPHNQTYSFLQEFGNLLGGKKYAHFLPRKHARFELSKVCGWAVKRGYGAIVVVGEDQHDEPATMTISMLPDGPCAHFRLTSIALHRQITGSANPTSHIPELVLSNFSTPLGLSTGRLLQSLFPPLPQIIGRQVVAVHNQRDYIFFRRFRYMFALRETEASRKAARDQGRDEHLRTRMQEIGPRFTMKLRWIKKGALAEGNSRRVGNEGLFKGLDLTVSASGSAEDGAVEEDLTQQEQDDEAQAQAEMLLQTGEMMAAHLNASAGQLGEEVAESNAPSAGQRATTAVSEDPIADNDAAVTQRMHSKLPVIERNRPPRTHDAEGRIMIPTFELPTEIPRDELPHHRKLKKGASVLDSLAAHVGYGRGGTKRKAMEWEWSPRMNVSRRKFAL